MHLGFPENWYLKVILRGAIFIDTQYNCLGQRRDWSCGWQVHSEEGSLVWGNGQAISFAHKSSFEAALYARDRVCLRKELV